MLRLTVDRVAKGGEGVARDRDGRVVFVRGALPGDTVDAEVLEERPRLARAEAVRVIAAGPGRVEPPCPHVSGGCGGCDWQHASADTQRELKLAIVADALERIGRFEEPPALRWAGSVPARDYRTTVRCTVVDGVAGFRMRRSSDGLPTPDCTIVHPAVRSIMSRGSFEAADEVSIRVGARTGDRSVVVSPRAPTNAATFVVGADDVDRGREVFIHEVVAGRRWRVSARSFFQSGPDAAELLVAEVGRRLRDLAAGATVCDLYAGIGLLAGSIGHDGPVVAVESNAAAVADAEQNLSDVDAHIVRVDVERWRPTKADVAIADPPRRGLGRAGVAVIEATSAATVVLVGCDPAAFARDARLLVDAGYHLGDVSVLDLFPQTSHVETVAAFFR